MDDNERHEVIDLNDGPLGLADGPWVEVAETEFDGPATLMAIGLLQVLAAKLSEWADLASALAMPLVLLTALILTAIFFFQIRDRLIPPHDPDHPSDVETEVGVGPAKLVHKNKRVPVVAPELADAEWEQEVEPDPALGHDDESIT